MLLALLLVPLGTALVAFAVPSNRRRPLLLPVAAPAPLRLPLPARAAPLLQPQRALPGGGLEVPHHRLRRDRAGAPRVAVPRVRCAPRRARGVAALRLAPPRCGRLLPPLAPRRLRVPARRLRHEDG